MKIAGSVLEEKSSFKMLGFYFSFKLCLLFSKKIGALIRSMKVLSSEAALYLYESTIQACMDYCCQVLASAPSCYLRYLG